MQITRPIQHSKNILHGIFPVIGAARYGIVGKQMEVIGITGTDGKSSTVILTAAMLRAAGHKVAHFSSVSFHDGFTETLNEMKMTTPGHMQLQKFLHAAINNGCTHAVVEITSQGILQHRHRFIGFSLVGITNITPEHIEAHGNFEQYQAAKLSLANSLLEHSKGLVIEKETYERVKDLLPQNSAVSIVAMHDTSQAVDVTLQEENPLGSVLTVTSGSEKVQIRSKLGGPFAPRNITFAIRIAALYSVSLEAIREAVESFERIPGRFEIISQEPLIIVDYAHTVHALKTLLPYVRSHTKRKLVHVFGAAGGGRDRYKRPLIAQMSQQYADASILTEENSFDEPVEQIIEEIKAGFSGDHTVHIQSHREDAVRLGLSLVTSKDDTLLLTAKGSETVIAGPGGSKRPYTERAYIRWLLETSSSA
jgi:UDP-N-acetylmuramoyl-L-alanyl-D-glutamate--2,6-diaminopimelate ligase